MNTFSWMKPQWLLAAALLVTLQGGGTARADEVGFARLPDDPEMVRQVSWRQPAWQGVPVYVGEAGDVVGAPPQGVPVYVGEAGEYIGGVPVEQPRVGMMTRINRILDGEEPIPGAIYTTAAGEDVYPPITTRFRCWWDDQCARSHARRAHNHALFWAHIHCKFGCLIPTGAGGHGNPPIGAYHRVYALDPHYFDGRDTKLYAAQGYGAPMTVPLAPTVRHSYNYGWGLPSSRLTPMTRITPYPVYGY